MGNDRRVMVLRLVDSAEPLGWLRLTSSGEVIADEETEPLLRTQARIGRQTEREAFDYLWRQGWTNGILTLGRVGWVGLLGDRM
jgi:hypothetical protein